MRIPMHPQGEGVQTWWKGGLYQVIYRKEATGGNWKSSRLECDTLSRTDWRSGRSHAQPIAASRFTMRHPEDQQGPDTLV
jgi:hypothetical protein